MRAQHNGRLLGERGGNHLQMPCVGGHGVCDVAHDVSGEAHLSIGIEDGEGDGAVGVRLNGEIALQGGSASLRPKERGTGTHEIPAIRAAMERVKPTVFVGIDLVLGTIDHEGAVLDAVRVASWIVSATPARHAEWLETKLIKKKPAAENVPGTPPRCGCNLSTE